MTHSKPYVYYFLLIVALSVTVFALSRAGFLSIAPAQAASDQVFKAPEFTHTDPKEWINSEPLSINDLKGKVVLLDIWTFGCWNCYRSFPWLKELEAKYTDKGLAVVGIHSPEFDHEKDHEAIKKKVKEFGLTHPVMVDNDFSYWKALGNRYWPTFYLIDKEGRVRGRFIGETHSGDRNATAIDAHVASLLAE